MAALMTRMSRSSTRRRTWVRAWVRPMMWWSRPLCRSVTCCVDVVDADPVVAVGAGCRGGFGACGVDGGGVARFGSERWALVVVDLDEGVELRLLVDRRCLGLSGEPRWRVWEAFDLPQVVFRQFLSTPSSARSVSEGVASAVPTRNRAV